jgi:hypothetical protein
VKKVKIKGIEVNEKQVWSCKVGFVDAHTLHPPNKYIPHDAPMRNAVVAAFVLLFGREPDFIFSGWNTDLDESEMRCVDREKP